MSGVAAVLVSGDYGMQLRAISRGLRCIATPDGLRLIGPASSFCMTPVGQSLPVHPAALAITSCRIDFTGIDALYEEMRAAGVVHPNGALQEQPVASRSSPSSTVTAT